ncbi:MAG: NUDIX hydrolase [Dissulfuribacterales bacterium]
MDTYRNPALTVDIIIETPQGVVLIERKNPPYGLALPGGFVDYGETVENAAKREALEETGLTIQLKGILGVYSDPSRDQRRHTVSVVFIASTTGTPQAGDDAKAVEIYSIDSLFKGMPAMTFDHALILKNYLEWKQDVRTIAQPLFTPSSSH